MKNKLKQKIKNMMGFNTSEIRRINEVEANYSKALKDLTDFNSSLKSPKISMTLRPDKTDFTKDVRKIVDGYDLVNSELEKYGDQKVLDMSEYDSLHSGTPMKTKPFKGSLRRLSFLKFDKTLYWYPATVGSARARQEIVDYLVREGFQKDACEGYGGLGINNIVFTCSTTHAFSLILNVIARPEDVILITGPNYGLFTIAPDRINARVEILPLKEEDHFLVNPNDLADKIDKINENLRKKFKNKLDYIPKVVAFLNLNPHNPIGNVMSKKDLPLITKIADVCLEKSVFIIDDLIYRDLTFDQNNLAYPIASIPKYFNNTISLFGISKAYGMASFRAGFVVVPTPIFWGMATQIFNSMDSIPTLQVKAVCGAFNGSDNRYKMAKKYFNKNIKEYLYRLDLAKSLIYGIDACQKENYEKIKKDIFDYTNDERVRNNLLKGIKGVKIRKGTFPESGFFLVLDFTELKGKYYKGKRINGEYDLLKAMYNYGKISYLMGENMSWPYEDEMVARTNFALDKNALINNYRLIGDLVRELKDEKD